MATQWSSRLNEVRFLARGSVLEYTGLGWFSLCLLILYFSRPSYCLLPLHYATSSNATSERSFYANMSQLAVTQCISFFLFSFPFFVIFYFFLPPFTLVAASEPLWSHEWEQEVDSDWKWSGITEPPRWKPGKIAGGPGNIRRQSEIKFTEEHRGLHLLAPTILRPAGSRSPISLEDERGEPNRRMGGRNEGGKSGGYEKVCLMHLKRGNTTGTVVSRLSCGRPP